MKYAVHVVVAFFVSAFLLLNSIFIVHETHQAILLQFGRVVGDSIFYSGLHFKIPFIQNVIVYDKRILNISSSEKEMIAYDQKRLLVDFFVQYRIVNPLLFLQSVMSESNFNYKLKTITESAIRQEVARVSLNSFLSDKREEVLLNINRVVSGKSDGFGVEIIDAQVKRVSLPSENRAAIFSRMAAERKKEAAQFRSEGKKELIRIKSNADMRVKSITSKAGHEAESIKGSAEKEAFKIYSAAFSNDEEFFNYYYSLKLYRNALDSRDTEVTMSSESDIFSILFSENHS